MDRLLKPVDVEATQQAESGLSVAIAVLLNILAVILLAVNPAVVIATWQWLL